MGRVKKLVGTGLFLAIGIIIILLVYRSIPFADVLDTFTSSTPWALVIFLSTSLTIMLLHAWRWGIVIKTMEHKVPFYKVFLYKVVGFGISFITPFAKVGGEPLRAAMLSKHDMSIEKGLSTVVIDKIIDMTTTGVMFVIAALIAVASIALPESMQVVLIVLSLAFVIIIGNLYYQMLNDRKIIVRIFKFFRLHKIKRFAKFEKNLLILMIALLIFTRRKQKLSTKQLQSLLLRGY